VSGWRSFWDGFALAQAVDFSATLGVLTLTQAQPTDLDLVVEIVDEAAGWLHAKGITQQWPSPSPPAFKEFMAQQIARGDVYLAHIDGDAIGTFRFDWTDVDLWRDDPDGGGYVHSFAIRQCAHGHRVGAAMIEWAKQHVREHGKKFLRLDCWGGNEPLREYYTRLGFTLINLVPEEDWIDATFQMEV
jgi:GNAT superfamily N-acetyltransferase